MREYYLRQLYKFLGHEGFITRLGSLDTVTKEFDNVFVSGISEVLDYARQWNGKRNLFISRARRNPNGTVHSSCVISFDIDPIRETEVATDDQHEMALNAGRRILSHYPGGYLCSSGNGCLLLYFGGTNPICNDYERQARFIQGTLRSLVHDLPVKIDSTAYDEAIIKLLGTQSTKGEEDKRRYARWIDWPSEPFRTSNKLMESIASIEALPNRVSTFDGDPEERFLSAKRLLAKIPATYADEYESWTKVGMALKEFGIAGLKLWDEWSKKSSKYEAGVCSQKFSTFKEVPECTLGTLRYWAKGQPEPQDTLEDFFKDIKPAEWICEPFIAKGAIIFVAGLPKTQKTWLLMDLALECAKGGGKWMERFPTKAAKVLFIDQERYKGETQRRFKAMITDKKLDVKQLNLTIKCGTSFIINADESYQELRSLIEREQPDVVIFDSFATIHTKEENSRKDIQEVLERIKRIRKDYGCAIIIIDHEGKSVLQSDNGVTKEPDGYAMVGSIAKPAAAETVITVRKNSDGTSTAHHVLSTISATYEPVKFKVVDTPLGIKLELIRS